jgi:hypothetical protein
MPVTRSSIIKSAPKVPYLKKSGALQRFENTRQSLNENNPQSLMQSEALADDEGELLNTEMEDADPNATTPSSPAASPEPGVIIAREGDNCLIHFPISHVLEYATNKATEGKGYEDKVDPNDSKFNSNVHVGILTQLKKDTGKRFPSLAYLVMTTRPNSRNQCTTGIVLNDETVAELKDCTLVAGKLYRMSKSNAIALLTKKRYDERNNNGPELNTSDYNPPLPTRSLGSVNPTEQREDTPMQSPKTKAVRLPFLPLQGGKCVIVAKEKQNCLVLSGKGLQHMNYQDAKAKGYVDKVENESNKLNSKADERDLTKLRQANVKGFSGMINSVYTSPLYHPNTRSTVIIPGDESRVYIMSKSSAQTALSKAIFDTKNKDFDESNVSTDDATNTSQSIIPTVETPSPSLKPQESLQVRAPQEIKGKYTIVGKDLRSPLQKLNDSTACMVCDENKVYTIMLWSQIKEAEEKSIATFSDNVPDENGLHPKADRTFLMDAKDNGTKAQIEIKDAILWRHLSKANKPVWFKSVLSEHTDKDKMEELYTKRQADKDFSQGQIRCSGSVFVASGHSKAALDNKLKVKYPKLWTEYVDSLKTRAGRDRSVTPEDYEELENRVKQLEDVVLGPRSFKPEPMG